MHNYRVVSVIVVFWGLFVQNPCWTDTSCEGEFNRYCRSGVVTNIAIDQSTVVVTTSAPYIKTQNEYDRFEESNCCSPNRTEVLYRNTQNVGVGGVSFEVSATSLFNLLLPAGYSLDGVKLTYNGSQTVTVQQASTSTIALPRCSMIDVIYGAAHTSKLSTYEGVKTCAKFYPPVGPGGLPQMVTCGSYLDLCAESYETLYDPSYLHYDTPVSPNTYACGTVSPNPCADPLNPACGS